MVRIYIRTAGICLVVFLIITLAFIKLNWSDSELNPEVAHIFSNYSREILVTPSYLEAYKRLIGLGCPKGEDPLEHGEKFYQLSKSGGELPPLRNLIVFENAPYFSHENGLWPRNLLTELKREVKKAEEKNSEILSRADTILKAGGAAADIPPQFGMVSANILLFLDVIRFQLAKINIQIHEGRFQESLDSLLQIQYFFSSLVMSRNTTLMVRVGLLVLEKVRSLLQEAAEQYPQFARLYNSQYRKKFSVILDFDKIKTNIVELEIFFLKGSINQIFSSKQSTPEWWGSSNFQETPSNLVLDYFIGHSPLWFRSFLFKKNETINEIYDNLKLSASPECVQSTKGCPTELNTRSIVSYLRNPMGKYLADKLWLFPPGLRMMAKTYQATQEINRYYSQ
jgi:hypothetical protein